MASSTSVSDEAADDDDDDEGEVRGVKGATGCSRAVSSAAPAEPKQAWSWATRS